MEQNPNYMGKNFSIIVETMHAPDNVHELTPEELKKREVIYIDIANDPVSQRVIINK